MESAPLTTAHSLARAASQSNTALEAVERHKAAAGEYANAAKGIEDVEALRILKLLEDYHGQLAQLVRTPAIQSSAAKSKILSHEARNKERATVEPVESNVVVREVPATTARSRSPVLNRRPHREMASSITTGLAAARGIPNAQQRKPRNLSPIGQGKEPGRILSQTPPFTEKRSGSTSTRGDPIFAKDTTKMEERQFKQAEKLDLSSTDDAFQKFYSTFGGLLSKLSAPLAFAGLPLVPQEDAESAKQDQLSSKRAPTISPETSHADVEKMFSKAAMRAVKEQNGPISGFRGVQESFCVVPAAGGTASYANILSRIDRHGRRHAPLPALDDDSGDHFVDASETPQPTSPRSTRRGVHIRSNKTVEELEIENASLKQLTENLNDRLYEWEKNAQKQTSVLQQSIRSLQSYQSHGSRAREATSQTEQPPNAEELLQLQEQHDATLREMERYARENEKLKTVVMRYRERWEKLKEGARVRREGAEGTETPPPPDV